MINEANNFHTLAVNESYTTDPLLFMSSITIVIHNPSLQGKKGKEIIIINDPVRAIYPEPDVRWKKICLTFILAVDHALMSPPWSSLEASIKPSFLHEATSSCFALLWFALLRVANLSSPNPGFAPWDQAQNPLPACD